MTFETRLFWASLDFLTPQRIHVLQKTFGSLDQAKKEFSPEMFERAGIPKRSVTSVSKKIQKLNFSEVQKAYEKSGSQLLFYEDEDFPEPLKNIPDPPVFLFARGTLQKTDVISLSVVGTRKPSTYGIQMVEQFVPHLVRSGFTIVSGMAAGIDSHAHNNAIAAGGRTIAFWGTGIDVVYPAQNRSLAEKISKNGVIFSEFPLGTEPNAFHFPRRNRLISGFSKGVVVIEGNEKSGSIITAHEALSQGKDVFAVPGNSTVKSAEGPNTLIQKGEAKLVMKAKDILEEYHMSSDSPVPTTFELESQVEKKIWNVLQTEPLPFDIIVQESGLSSAEVSSVLMMMTLRGGVKDEGNATFRRIF